jgi:alpha,alpha-trehalase
MKKTYFSLYLGAFVIYLLLPLNLIAQISPGKRYGNLYMQVEMDQIFKDQKTFPDCIARKPPDIIMKKYKAKKNKAGFNLHAFVRKYFKLPPSYSSHFHSDTMVSVAEHINRLWPVLTWQPQDTAKYSSLIPLPNPYVVPGGHFREMYYWDSYFTILGLAQSGKINLVKDMLNDFASLIKRYGFVPNANRTYYLDRSQPPFFFADGAALCQGNK